METLKNLLMTYSAMVAINIVVAGLLWNRFRTQLYFYLLLIWCGTMLSFILSGMTIEASTLARSLAFSTAIFTSIPIALLLRSLCNLKLAWRRYLGAMGVAVLTTVLLDRLGAPELLYAFPIPLAVGLPGFSVSYQALILKRGLSGRSIAHKGLAGTIFLFSIHNVLYAFFHAWPAGQTAGFIVALLLVFGISIFAPAAVVESMLVENEGLRIHARFREQLIYSSKMSALGEMAGGVAHEINNPLTILSLTVQRLLKDAESSGTQSTLGARAGSNALASIHRISKIIQSLKTFANEGSTDPKTWVALPALLDEALNLFRARLEEKRVRFDFGQVPAVQVFCRPSQILQVIMNLINNAVDAVESLPAPWISLDAKISEKNAVISVTDSGNPIPGPVIEKMMQPFFTTKPIGKGTGLGLSVSKGIIEEHQGELLFDASAAHTKFRFTLPVQG
jgi:signal transduction histidine kinase